MTPGWVLDALADAVRAVGAALGSDVLSRGADALARDGALLATRVVEAVEAIDDPARLAALAEGGAALPAVAEITAARRLQARGVRLLDELVRAAATVALARRAGRIDYADRAAALAMQATLSDLLDARAHAAGVAAYSALRDLRAGIVARLAEIAPRLPSVRVAEVDAPIPSLVVAYDLYGDATRGQEIAARNRVPRPGFVRGPIEVKTA